mmetsp:Transcript_15843/g.26638  ORF Transcript_15843/g.26638 Transcript_15843/m.26638 type:complete len:211 (-) Transcript_15843:309-941(-)
MGVPPHFINGTSWGLLLHQLVGFILNAYPLPWSLRQTPLKIGSPLRLCRSIDPTVYPNFNISAVNDTSTCFSYCFFVLTLKELKALNTSTAAAPGMANACACTCPATSQLKRQPTMPIFDSALDWDSIISVKIPSHSPFFLFSKGPRASVPKKTNVPNLGTTLCPMALTNTLCASISVELALEYTKATFSADEGKSDASLFRVPPATLNT